LKTKLCGYVENFSAAYKTCQQNFVLNEQASSLTSVMSSLPACLVVAPTHCFCYLVRSASFAVCHVTLAIISLVKRNGPVS